MIDLQFGLFHSGCDLTYLRYLTFKSLRHFHPDAKIQLFHSKSFKKDGHNWNNEKQDFERGDQIHTKYLKKLDKLDVEVIKFDKFKEYAPNYQSDFFRWWYLKKYGGFYLDTDQIILKSFKTLPLENKLIYSVYANYCPVGVIGASKDSKVVEYINNNINNHYDPNDYNSLGPWMFRSIMSKVKMKEGFNAPPEFFYPAPLSDFVHMIYNGKLGLTNENFALHWFGGAYKSQAFNSSYNEEFAKTSNDTISRFLRENNII